MYYHSRTAIKEEALKNAEQTLESTVQHIDNILLSVEQSLGNVYWDMLTHLNEPDRMSSYCRQLLENNPNIYGCAIAFQPYYYPNRELFMVYVHRKGIQNDTNAQDEFVTSNVFTNRPYTEQIWYTTPIETGQPGWTAPLKNEDTEGEPITTFFLPIYDSSRTCVGVIAADVSIRFLSNTALVYKPSPHGYTTMIDNDGSYIVHPDTIKLSQQTVFTQTESGKNPTIKAAAEAMLSGETGHKSFLLNDQEFLVFYKPFHRYKVPGRSLQELKWTVGVIYPKDDIFSDFDFLRQYILLIAVIGLSLFFVICLYVTHRQLLPLRLLTRSAQHIAEGDYNQAIPDTKREDEIGVLQEHFQTMQKSLREHISQLEQLTATLNERGQQLQKAYHDAQKADRMKTAFLHNMTNQMIEPSNAIQSNVLSLCENYHEISLETAAREAEEIEKQGKIIAELLNNLLHMAEDETGKEDDHALE
jgi:methyl-accepting chemotaxis protein/sigma-B regulation protein RsbU (phosphoserine phosphatase)